MHLAAVLETLYRLEWEPGTQEAEVLELSQASWAGGAEPEQGETGSRVEPWRSEAGPAQGVAIDTAPPEGISEPGNPAIRLPPHVSLTC